MSYEPLSDDLRIKQEGESYLIWEYTDGNWEWSRRMSDPEMREMTADYDWIEERDGYDYWRRSH
jgi:hypothetical protein